MIKNLYQSQVNNRIAVILFLIISSGSLMACTLSENTAQQSSPGQQNQPEFNRFLSSISLPAELSFCGERVPLEIPEVRERAEREFYLNLQSPGQIILYLKRAGRYFPVFEKILKEEKAPDDLKFLAVAESALYMARSTKDAVGIWQFMPSTAKAMGLIVDEYVDERRHVEKSTHAAIQYLRSGYNAHKSWTLAAAGYNMGQENVRDNTDFQQKNSFYDLYLNEETSRYILRIAIVKEIMMNPARYGFTLQDKDLYKPEPQKFIRWEQAIPDLAAWAKEQGTTYKDIKLLNPWILKRSLHAPRHGAWFITVPG
jgi:hypothetical protein